MSFLETPRFPDDIAGGVSGGPGYQTEIAGTGAGHEKRDIKWAYGLHEFAAGWGVRSEAQLYSLTEYHHAMAGRGHGFRFKDHGDYKSGAPGDAITNQDQVLGAGDGVTLAFQLIKTYTEGVISRLRNINKPVIATTIVAIGTVAQSLRWAVDTTNGIVTFDADIIGAITGASQANPCVITDVAHGLVTGDSPYISGVVGMVELNDLRYTITKLTNDTYSLDGIDSTAFTAYGSGGVTNTLPQTGESVKAGFEFDVPCRFASDKLSKSLETYGVGSAQAPVTEIRV